MTSSTAQHRTMLSVPAAHPSLRGHFPGRPVVPGVVLLELVLQAGEEWLGRPIRVSALAHVKFVAPLLPDQPAEFTLQLEGGRLDFRIAHGPQPIAHGRFQIEPAGNP